MDKGEIIERLKNIAGHAVHTVGERPFVMSLDDGIAVHEVIKLLTNCPEIPDSCNTETVEAIPVDWIKAYIEEVDAMPDKLVWGHDKNAILTMLKAWEVRKEQHGQTD